MCKLKRNISMLALAVIMLGVLLTACGSPPSTAQSEEELIFYMREHIILKEILPNFAYIPPTDTPGYVNRAQTSLIVLAPLKKNLDDLHQPLDLDHPIQAWWYANNRLGDVSDPIVAIDLYRENYDQLGT